MILYGKDLDTKRGQVRAGVIPYTIKDNQVYFLLGIDRRTRELTDFGGGVKSDETILEAAQRELGEETCKLFGNTVTKKHLRYSPAVCNTNRDTAILFLLIDPMWIDYAEELFSNFQGNYNNIKKHTELIGVKWVTEKYFQKVAFNRRVQCMWRRIQNLLRLNTSWCDLRCTLMFGKIVAHTRLSVYSNKSIRSQLKRCIQVMC